MTDLPNVREVADWLVARGWSPVPLPARAKTPPPPGFTGYAGKYARRAHVQQWDDEGLWNGNIAIRLPPDVVGVDVDAYKGGEDGFAELVGKFGPLPLTVCSTSREDTSGIGLFRVPVGTTLATNPAEGVEMIQMHHRYVVTWPSIHPEGRLYKWVDDRSGLRFDMDDWEGPIDIDDLPELPWAWVEGLAVSKTEAARAATPDEVRAFIDEHVAQTRPTALKGVCKSLTDYQGARHDTLVEHACWSLREAAAGLYSAEAAIGVLHTWWRRVMDDPERRDNGEFGAAVMWAVAQVKGEPERVAEIAKRPIEPPTNIDTDTGEILEPGWTNLPEKFWQHRPVFSHIRAAAHSRMVSADAVLLAVLARVVMLTPPTITLPAIVGSRVSLNLFVSIIDASGGGKSAAVNVARELLPHKREDIADPILPSSGEGLIEAYMGTEEIEGPDGKKRKERKQTKRAGLAWVDEGQGLLAQADRSGSTIMETIRSAWMGGDLGQHNATEERKRWLKAHRYRLSMIVGFQLAYAATLIADGEGGTPQRFTFALASDPTIDPRAEWPGEIDFMPEPSIASGHDMQFDSDVVTGIRARRLERSRGLVKVDPLDTHADVRKMKLAAALALLDGRVHVSADDWELAEEIDATSRAVRSLAIEHARVQTALARRLATAVSIEREATVEAAQIERTLLRVARNVARKVWREGPMSPSAAYRVVTSKDRSKADLDDVIRVAVDAGWLTLDGLDVAPGKDRP